MLHKNKSSNFLFLVVSLYQLISVRYMHYYLFTKVCIIRASQKFCNILVTWDTIWQLWMLLERLLRGQTSIDLGDADLTWYYPNATHQICLNSLEHSLRIYNFRPTQSCHQHLATQVKFLESSSYWTMINYAIIFLTTN